MAKNINSITTLLPQLLRLFNNSLESFDKISEAVTSNRETVAIDLLDENDNLKRVFVPSFGFIKSELERLEENIKNSAGLGSGQSTVRLADGTFRKILVSKINSEAKDITSMNSVNSFETRTNHFFESFINPSLFVTFDITGQAPIDTERIKVNRFILDLDAASKINFFNTNFKEKSDIEYDQFIIDLLENNIGFIQDENVVDLPPRELRFIGNFSVIRISNVETTEEINGEDITTTKKAFKLNRLTYTDISSGFTDTLSLKIGDALVVNSEPKDTRYKIISIDSSTNTVILKLVEGFRQVKIGSDVLSFFSTQDETLEIEVNIGFNEYNIVFIKSIDPDSKIPANDWSPGSAFFTNDLKITREDGTVQDLETFYRNEVVDFGNFILGIAKDAIPPSTLGLIPDPPVLSVGDFKVVQVNRQITETRTIEELKQIQDEKVSLQSDIKELDKSIKSKREAVATKVYNNDTERDADRNEIRSLIEERNSKSDLFASLVRDIEAKRINESLSSAKPKFKIRGFFPQPKPKNAPQTGNQEVVQFIKQHRFLTKDGAANPVEQIEFQDGEVGRQGSFTNWIEIKSKVRERIFDSELGKYVWLDEDVEDGDATNSNSIDISIRKGESVEIRIKSVSEAGFPSNPVTSDFSEIIKIDFPEELSSDDVIKEIIEENTRELARVQLREELSSQGVNKHIERSFTANEKFFAHPATDVASGFLSQEQTPITLFDKLTEIDIKLKEFEEILKKVKGSLVIKITDEEGNEVLVKKNQLNKIFAGYYSDIVADLNVKKGVIVSKTFFLTLENIAATTLELISRLPGTQSLRIKSSEDPNITTFVPLTYDYYSNFDSFDSTDTDYNNKKKYDLVPIVLANPEDPDNEIAVLPPFQSSQFKSQFIYARYLDIANEDRFYSYEAPNTDGNPSGDFVDSASDGEYKYGRITATTDVSPTNFIWGGQFDMSGGGTPFKATDLEAADDDTIEVHIDHPKIAKAASFVAAYEKLIGNGSITPPGGGNWDVTVFAQQLFRQSKFAKLQATSPFGKKQNIYLFDNPDAINPPATTDLPAGFSAARTLKTSFEDDDQFLLGKKSCGAYMFLASDTPDNIVVDGKTALSLKEIEFGSENAVRIPIIFQFRMTDYFGDGDQGIGNIGGDGDETTTNLTYSKQIGFDVIDVDNNIFSFDLEITAKFKSDNLNLNKIPTRNIELALDDFRRTLKGISPSIIETKIDARRGS